MSPAATAWRRSPPARSTWPGSPSAPRSAASSSGRSPTCPGSSPWRPATRSPPGPASNPPTCRTPGSSGCRRTRCHAPNSTTGLRHQRHGLGHRDPARRTRPRPRRRTRTPRVAGPRASRPAAGPAARPARPHRRLGRPGMGDPRPARPRLRGHRRHPLRDAARRRPRARRHLLTGVTPPNAGGALPRSPPTGRPAGPAPARLGAARTVALRAGSAFARTRAGSPVSSCGRSGCARSR